MNHLPRSIRLTTAQAIVRHPANQRIEFDGVKKRLCGGGFIGIKRLQNSTGNTSFNNLIADNNIEDEPFSVDFTTHAHTMGAASEEVRSIEELKWTFGWAQQSKKTGVIGLKVDACEGWTKKGHKCWQIGTPAASNRLEVLLAHDVVEHERLRVGM